MKYLKFKNTSGLDTYIPVDIIRRFEETENNTTKIYCSSYGDEETFELHMCVNDLLVDKILDSSEDEIISIGYPDTDRTETELPPVGDI